MTPGPNLAGACNYCGLPLVGEIHDSSPPALATRYCCFGCRFAATIAAENNAAAAGPERTALTRLGLALFLSMNVMVATMFLWSQPGGAAEGAAAVMYDLFRWLGLVLSTPVVLLLGGPLWHDAWQELQARRLSASLLLVLGVLAAYAYSLASVLFTGPVYFEVVCMVLVAVTLGRWLEATGKLKTTAALRALKKLLPDRVRRITQGVEEMVRYEALEIGHLVRVLPGERIPVDGVIVRHQAAIDEQAVTGESAPVVKETGDPVYSGTLNLDGDLTISATAAAGAGTLEQLLNSVMAAAARRGKYQRLADRLAAWFLPFVLGAAALTFLWHSQGGNGGPALLAALAVVVIACPCALGLATPLALWAALGRAARAQVLFRNGDALAQLATAKVVCLDKTGTLTTGAAQLERWHTVEAKRAPAALALAQALAAGSTHPLAAAVAAAAVPGCEPNERDLAACKFSSLRTLPGRGVRGEYAHGAPPAYLGSERLMRETGQHGLEELLASAASIVAPSHSLMFVAQGGSVRGLFLLREETRDSARAAAAELQQLGLRLLLLTGDRTARAEALAHELGVEARAELLPQEKLATVEQLRAEVGPVIMVGDGINDAPALAAADVGMALGCGTDVSRYTAGVCLLSSDLRRLAWTVRLARQTRRIIAWNLLWAFGYNALGMGIAAAGLLNPVIAALAMVVSSVMVVSNSLRLAEDDHTVRPQPMGPAANAVTQNVAEASHA